MKNIESPKLGAAPPQLSNCGGKLPPLPPPPPPAPASLTSLFILHAFRWTHWLSFLFLRRLGSAVTFRSEILLHCRSHSSTLHPFTLWEGQCSRPWAKSATPVTLIHFTCAPGNWSPLGNQPWRGPAGRDAVRGCLSRRDTYVMTRAPPGTEVRAPNPSTGSEHRVRAPRPSTGSEHRGRTSRRPGHRGAGSRAARPIGRLASGQKPCPSDAGRPI